MAIRIRFPSRTTIRVSRVLLALSGSVAVASIYLTLVPDETVARLAALPLLLSFGLGALSIRGLIGPPVSSRDHLRPGERPRLRAAITVALIVAGGILALPSAMIRPPLWACVFLVALAGPTLAIALVASVRLRRDTNRWGCPGAYGDCRDCDTILPIGDLNDLLKSLDDDALEEWRTDPETGVEVRVPLKRNRVDTHTIDDHGHELQQVYLLGGVTGAHVPRLIPLVTYDDGFQEIPDLDESECDRISLGPAEVQAVYDQVSRTLK